jgi:hypothetical protein
MQSQSVDCTQFDPKPKIIIEKNENQINYQFTINGSVID